MTKGYFNASLHRLFGHVSSIEEDWEKKTIECQLFSSNDSLKLTIPTAEELKVLGENVRLTVYAKGDDRYMDQGDIGVVMVIFLSNVMFPETPK